MLFYANDTTATLILTLDGVDISDCVIHSYDETWESEHSEEFRIGCFPSREIKFGLNMAMFRSKFPEGTVPPFEGDWVVQWKVKYNVNDEFIEEVIPGGTFLLTEADVDYDDNAMVTLYDYAILTDVPYNFTELDYEAGTTTVAQVQEIANHFGFTLEGLENVRSKDVKWQDGIMSVRTHLEYIAELSACNLYFTSEGKLRFSRVKVDTPQIELPLEFVVDDYAQGDTVTFTRTLWNNGIIELASGNEDGSTLYISANNPYVDAPLDEEGNVVTTDIDYIHQHISGLTITNVPEMKAFGNPLINVFDNILLKDGDAIHATILVNSLRMSFNQAFTNRMTANIQSAQYERVAKYYGDATIRRMQVLIDNNKQQIVFLFENQEQAELNLKKYIRFATGKIELGEVVVPGVGPEFVYTMIIANDGLAIGKVRAEDTSIDGAKNIQEVAYFRADKMFIENAQVVHSLQLGNVVFIAEQNGSMSLKRVG